MAKVKSYSVTRPVKDNNGNVYTIFVYGEVTEEKLLDGIEVRRVKYNHWTGERTTSEDNFTIYPLGDNCSPTKTFNYGYAICSPEDEFDEKIGIEVARRRFSKSPIRTQDCRFLKKGMVEAILEQSADYIETHELKTILENKENINEFSKNFKDGEIICKHGVYAAIGNVDSNGNVKLYWAAMPEHNWARFGEFTKDIKCLHSFTAPHEYEIEEINRFFKSRYNNKWDSENKKFIKA